MSKVTAVVNRVPSSPPTLPYIVVEGGDSLPFRGLSPEGEKITIPLSVYGKTDELSDLQAILSDVQRVLIHQPLVISGVGQGVGVLVTSQWIQNPANDQVRMKISMDC